MKKHVANGVFWLTFLALCLQTTILKSGFYNALSTFSGETPLSYLTGRIAQRPTIRWLGDVIIAFYDQVTIGMMSLAYWGANNSIGFDGSPWSIGLTLDVLVAGPAIPFVTLILYYVTCSLPVAIIVQLTMPTFFTQMVMLILIWGAFVGWPPSVITAFFELGALAVDWPRSYYLYAQTLFYHDFAAFAVVACQFIYLTQRQSPQLWEVILITFLSHGAFEYLGMLFGITYAARALFDLRRESIRTQAFEIARRLCVTGAIVIVAALSTYLIYHYWHDGELIAGVDVGGFGISQEIENNFNWIRTIIANLITMILLAGIAGAVSSAVRLCIGNQYRPDKSIVYLQLSILTGIAIGVLAIFAIGMFTVPYPSEMGRQFAPFMTMFFMIGLRLIDLLVLTRFDRTT